MLLPTVIVCCHGNAGVTQACFFGKDHLWHGGHVDDIGAPLAEHQALGPRGEARPLDGQHGPSVMTFHPQTPSHFQQDLSVDTVSRRHRFLEESVSKMFSVWNNPQVNCVVKRL